MPHCWLQDCTSSSIHKWMNCWWSSSEGKKHMWGILFTIIAILLAKSLLFWFYVGQFKKYRPKVATTHNHSQLFSGSYNMKRSRGWFKIIFLKRNWFIIQQLIELQYSLLWYIVNAKNLQGFKKPRQISRKKFWQVLLNFEIPSLSKAVHKSQTIKNGKNILWTYKHLVVMFYDFP